MQYLLLQKLQTNATATGAERDRQHCARPRTSARTRPPRTHTPPVPNATANIAPVHAPALAPVLANPYAAKWKKYTFLDIFLFSPRPPVCLYELYQKFVKMSSHNIFLSKNRLFYTVLFVQFMNINKQNMNF